MFSHDGGGVSAVLDALDDDQRAVATFDGGPLRVLAGAGTGKTTALTARVAHLVATGTPPERILLLTFTRRAAHEMLSRTAALLARSGGHHAAGRGAAGRVVGGTFHAVAHRTLRRHASRLGLPEGFGVLDVGDAADVIDLVRQELGLATSTGVRFPRKATLLDLYSRAVNTQQPLSTVIDDIAPWCADRVDDVAAVCRGYVARKRSLGLLDFDDLLLWWRAAMADDPAGRSTGAAFDHVLVDEYQDVNALQVDVLAAIRRDDLRITAVGDDAQAVYGFRAASAEHLLRFDEAFPGASTVLLTTNYRSTQAICDVANAVGEDAPRGFEVRLRAADRGPARRRPLLRRCADGDEQASAVCDAVLAAREEGVALRRQAILVRSSHHSDLVELELSRRRIPFVKYGGLKFLEAAHVKDLVCAFRLADNPRDTLAWFRLLQLLDGVGPVTARRVVDALGLGDDTVAGTDGDIALHWPIAAEALPASARPLADALVGALAARPGETVAVHALRLRDALAPIVAAAYDDGATRLGDLDALCTAAADAARLTDVAAELTLDAPRSTGDLAGPPLVDEDWVVISTVHSAKGLEWDVVHVLGVVDGAFPSDMAVGSAEGIEEERRLFYVAVTRARRELALYAPLRFHHRPRGRDDRHSYAPLSRFLSDGVRSCLTEVQPPPRRVEVPVAAVSAVGARVAAELDSLWS